AYHDNQPFNNNHLRPCPMLENPTRLRELVKETGAVNTDYEAPESVDHLCDKCVSYAENWKPTAEKLWRSLIPAAADAPGAESNQRIFRKNCIDIKNVRYLA